jgi:hypothetical protein
MLNTTELAPGGAPVELFSELLVSSTKLAALQMDSKSSTSKREDTSLAEAIDLELELSEEAL